MPSDTHGRHTNLYGDNQTVVANQWQYVDNREERTLPDAVRQKSEIAIEYAREDYERDRDLWVFWINGANYESFIDSYEEVIDILDQSRGQRCSRTGLETLKLAHRRLKQPGRRWLLVIDNANDLRDARDLARHIPHDSDEGSILLTSQDQAVARALGIRHKEMVVVGNMKQCEAQALLNRRLVGNVDRSYHDKLIEQVGRNPLVICQAAAYVDSNSTNMSMSKYIHFLKREKEALALLDIRTDIGTHSSIAPLKAVRQSSAQSNPFSVFALKIMVFFSQTIAVPKSLLRASLKMFKTKSKTKRENTLRRLEERFWVLTPDGHSVLKPDDHSYKLHVVVQLGIRSWLRKRRIWDERQSDAIRVLADFFPDEWSGDSDMADVLYPHRAALLELPQEDVHGMSVRLEPRTGRKDLAELLRRVSWYLEAKQKPGLSECAARKAMSILETHEGAERREKIRCRLILARRLCRRGVFEEAISHARNAQKDARRILDDHALIGNVRRRSQS
ncbi:hypothetical protein FKW77_009947 [Venturia effusa]|uniref:NB-ARC domain-containing protein n=1 Tax=Venturia effusa TaxID=50376 RepID=A0A517L880_9PEZI|nr:hypothetical protein FKW77_009947 [Venturia effusa]